MISIDVFSMINLQRPADDLEGIPETDDDNFNNINLAFRCLEGDMPLNEDTLEHMRHSFSMDELKATLQGISIEKPWSLIQKFIVGRVVIRSQWEAS